MSILTPDHELIAKVATIVDDVNADYLKFLESNSDDDDIDYLAKMLEEATTAEIPLANISWAAYDDERPDPNEWVSAMTGLTESATFISVYLWIRNLEQKWGPKTFKEVVLGMLAHETIHIAQYNRIGFDTLRDKNLKSGHQLGTELKAKTGDPDIWMQCYLSDPHELMAYGHDLAADIKANDKPEEALRSPETNREDLPVYNLYRQFFDVDSKQIKRLLSYAARYYEIV
jgi:hypothetical protein